MVLALGYGGGYRAFQSMARGYNVKVTDDNAEGIKKKWRSNNEWAVDYWKRLEFSAVAAARDPGTEHGAGMVNYCKPGPETPLYCQLPSGRMLSYPDARVDLVESKYGTNWELSAIKAQWTPKQDEKEWPRIKIYGGLLAENITQAVAADILRHAMQMLAFPVHLFDDDGLPLVGHTHDECLLEVAEHSAEKVEKCLREIMLDLPEWAADLPMAVETWTGQRYRK